MLPQRSTPSTVTESLSTSLSSDQILSTMASPCAGLRPVIDYAVNTHGKRLRSRLLVLSARTLSPQPESLAETAVLVELLHNGTLLHDDVMDRATVRRHRPTVNRLWGDPVAILAGDFLLVAVMDLALKTRVEAVPRLTVDTLMHLLSGQMQEIRNQGNLSLDEGEYLEIIGKKTGALFAASCTLGGLVAGGEPEQLRALGTFGRQLGLAFQLLDDLRDYLSEQARTGKEPGRDLAEAKVTLPLIAALRNANQEQRRTVRHLFAGNDRGRHLQRFRALIQDLGGFSYTLALARGCIHRAVRSLEDLPCGEARSSLAGAARALLEGEVK